MKRLSFPRIWSYTLKKKPVASTVLILFTLLGGVAGPLEILFRQRLIDSIGLAEVSALAASAAGLALCWGYSHYAKAVRDSLNNRIQAGCRSEIADRINGRIAVLHYQYFEHQQTLDQIKRIRQHPVLGRPEEVYQAAFAGALTLAALLIESVLVFKLMAQTALWIGLVILLLALLSSAVTISASRRVYQTLRETSEAERFSQYYEQLLKDRENAQERILFSPQPLLAEKWERCFQAYLKRSVTSSVFYRLKGMGLQMVNIGFMVAVILLFLPALTAGRITAGFYISMVMGISSFSSVLNTLLPDTIANLSTAGEWIKDYNHLFQLDTVEEGGAGLPAGCRVETIEFCSVSFTYPFSETPVLKDLSFKLERGRHYAVVGANGSGKSTLIKLLTGLYAPTRGQIRINGREIGSFSRGELNCMMAVDFQDFTRYAATLRENVAIGKMGTALPDETIQEMLAEMGVSLKDVTLDTVLGKIAEGGVDLSGGQWQLVSLARTLIGGKSLVILDEPTAALDPKNESLLYEKFAGTVDCDLSIMISHRLGSTKNADIILVLDDGRLIEQGTHGELMAQGGKYAEMFESQARWYR